MTNESNSNANGNYATNTPHRTNAALRSESPYQQRTTQKDNPTQQLIKQSVEFLLKQLEEGKSETLDRVSGGNGPLPQLQLRQHSRHRAAAPDRDPRRRYPHLERVGPVREERRERHPDSCPHR